MKKFFLLCLLVLSAFLAGYGFKTFTSPLPKFKKVTGIGGIFFKCKNPKQVREWYQTHLGLQVNPYGSVFEFYQGADSTRKGFLQWSPFSEKTKYFEPSTKEFMINYRVENLELLTAELKMEGVVVLDTIQEYDYGKFVHLLDPEGNKVELWEPNDLVYEKLGKEMGYQTTK